MLQGFKLIIKKKQLPKHFHTQLATANKNGLALK